MHLVPLVRTCVRPLLTFALIASTLCPLQQAGAAEADTEESKQNEDIIVLEKFVASESANDPFGLLPKNAVRTAVGFDRKLEDTPRSVSIVSSEMIDKVGIRDADQL